MSDWTEIPREELRVGDVFVVERYQIGQKYCYKKVTSRSRDGDIFYRCVLHESSGGRIPLRGFDVHRLNSKSLLEPQKDEINIPGITRLVRWGWHPNENSVLEFTSLSQALLYKLTQGGAEFDIDLIELFLDGQEETIKAYYQALRDEGKSE